MRYRLFLVLIVAVSLVSCRSKKKILYFQNSSEIEAKEQSYSYELKIQPDDLLYIHVMGEDEESVKVFNKFGVLYEDKENGGANNNSSANLRLNSYLVDNYGFIDYPVLGRLKVSDLTKSSLVNLLQQKLSVYVKNPVINVRFLNFKITVLGEAGKGAETLTFETEKVSLPQLLSEVKDMTMGSERYKIVVVREKDGIKTIGRVDMTQASVINSPYYYLAQNDVVYIEPTRNKIDSGAIPSSLKNASIILATIVSILLIFNNIK